MNVIRLTRTIPDEEHGMTPEQWVRDAADVLLDICVEWAAESGGAEMGHASPEEQRRRRVAQIAVNMAELHERLT